MGWASYLEDIVLKIDDNLHKAQEAFNSGDLETTRKAALNVLREAKIHSEKMWKLLDYATSPEVDVLSKLSKQLSKLEYENSSLECRLESKEGENAELNQKILELSQKIVKLKKEIKKLEKDLQKSEESFEKLAEKNPSAAMEAFTNEKMISEYKSNA